MMHVALKKTDETKMVTHHQKLQETIEDQVFFIIPHFTIYDHCDHFSFPHPLFFQLSLAAIHFTRGHYQEAIDVYKRILLDHRDFIALNVNIALCYYKLDYHDVSQEVLNSCVKIILSQNYTG